MTTIWFFLVLGGAPQVVGGFTARIECEHARTEVSAWQSVSGRCYRGVAK